MDRRLALVAGLGPLAAPGWAAPNGPRPRIVFLNPGEAVERGKGPQWPMAAHCMGVAAQAFGMDLEVLYAERDHLRMQQQAHELSQRRNPPDYAVIVNEKLSALEMLKTLASVPTKVLLIHNDLTAGQRREIGNERERLPNWIGTAVTDEVRTQSRLMAELYRQLGEREPRVVGITGDRSTPVSLQRAQGVSDHVRRARRGQVLQLAFGDWSAADAEQKTHVLLSRYPDTNILWAANDSMALGALRAVQARGARVLVGGTGAWPDALQSIADGRLAASVGSHFFIGAWAMVLLHDYHQGRDFAASGGVTQKLDYMIVVNRDTAPLYERAVYQRAAAPDVRAYSKALHPRAGGYDFNLAALVHPSSK